MVLQKNLSRLEEEFLNPVSTSVLIKFDDTYIGILDYLMENPNDHCPWLGLLMIHGDYRGFGFGHRRLLFIKKKCVNEV